MKRRKFIKKAAAATAVTAGCALPFVIGRLLAPVQSRPVRNYLRPPGALTDDAAFVAACIGCGLCGEVCPPRCIRFHTRAGGGKVNTPYIEAEQRACTLCGKCMDVCPTHALTPTPRNEIRMGFAEIDQTACYPWVDRGICGACVSICPIGERAIGFKMWNQYRPVIRKDCVGCGLCVEVCPHPSTPIWIVRRSNAAA